MYGRMVICCSGVVSELVDLPGHYYTVNPIAVHSDSCNVLADNKRGLAKISSPQFGDVAFVPVGATMVGSIR